MRCLEKDRNRRYETASGLARDVQRFLEGDSVEACPPTLGYRLRKLYRRNRAAVWVGALMLGLTYAGASGIYFAYRRAVHAEARLAVQRDAALVSEHRAIVATVEAAAERDKVAEANASLRTLADRQRRTLYASSMNLAQAAWESGDARRTLELLRQWVPKPAEKDLRGFEWHYWNRQAHQESAERSPPGTDAPGPGDGSPRRCESRRDEGGRGGERSGSLHLDDPALGRDKRASTLAEPPRSREAFESCSFSDNGQRLLTSHIVRGVGVPDEARVWDVKRRNAGPHVDPAREHAIALHPRVSLGGW